MSHSENTVIALANTIAKAGCTEPAIRPKRINWYIGNFDVCNIVMFNKISLISYMW